MADTAMPNPDPSERVPDNTHPTQGPSAAPAYVTESQSKEADKTRAELRRLGRVVTIALAVLALGCLIFTAKNVNDFAVEHHISQWISWLLDPLLTCALLLCLYADGVLSQQPGYRSLGWQFALRITAGGGTWVMNVWESIWPTNAAFPGLDHVDVAGVVLHSAVPVMTIMLAEAAAGYRRYIARRIGELDAIIQARIGIEQAEREAARQRQIEARKQAEEQRRWEAEQAKNEVREAEEREAEREAKRREFEAAERREREAREHELAVIDRKAKARAEAKVFEANAKAQREGLIEQGGPGEASSETTLGKASEGDTSRASESGAGRASGSGSRRASQTGRRRGKRGGRTASQTGLTRAEREAQRGDAIEHAMSLIREGGTVTAKAIADHYGRGETWGGDAIREARRRIDVDLEAAMSEEVPEHQDASAGTRQ